jgi:hypothetical protein
MELAAAENSPRRTHSRQEAGKDAPRPGTAAGDEDARANRGSGELVEVVERMGSCSAAGGVHLASTKRAYWFCTPPNSHSLITMKQMCAEEVISSRCITVCAQRHSGRYTTALDVCSLVQYRRRGLQHARITTFAGLIPATSCCTTHQRLSSCRTRSSPVLLVAGNLQS